MVVVRIMPKQRLAGSRVARLSAVRASGWTSRPACSPRRNVPWSAATVRESVATVPYT